MLCLNTFFLGCFVRYPAAAVAEAIVQPRIVIVVEQDEHLRMKHSKKTNNHPVVVQVFHFEIR